MHNAANAARRAPRHSLARRAIRVLVRAFAAVGVMTVLAVATPVVHWWALASAPPREQPRGDVLIVLSAARDQNGGMSFSSYWRARMAVEAWKNGGFHKAIVCGSGVPAIANYMAAEGVPAGAIVAESASKSTRENALNAARLLENIPGRRVLLTSDFHMFRALRVFRKAGVDAAPLPVDDAIRNSKEWAGRFSVLQNLVVENLKIVYYRMRGWI